MCAELCAGAWSGGTDGGESEGAADLCQRRCVPHYNEKRCAPGDAHERRDPGAGRFPLTWDVSSRFKSMAACEELCRL